MDVRFKFGVKKVGLAILFSTLYAFRIILRPLSWGEFQNGLLTPTQAEEEIQKRYKEAVDEVDVHACIEEGQPESVCRSKIQTAI
jgi:hypothetical protein